MTQTNPSTTSNATRILFTATALFFLACAIFYNTWLVDVAVKAMRAAIGRPRIPDPSHVRKMEVAFLVLSAAFFVLSWLVSATHRLDRFTRRTAVQKLVLALLAFTVPIATLELTLRPFAERLSKSTSLFTRDDQRGWKMRPNAEEMWGGVAAKTNSHGLRGPDIPYAKPAGTKRILYLGDSVTFGYRIVDDAQTFPLMVERLLEEQTNNEIESINSGCGGYSPWQEHLFLVDEGFQYSPDIVVVGFVLNDVTEKFHLVQFGGQEEGFQLTHSYYSWLDRILTRSGLAYQVRNLTREFKAKRKLGDDIQLGAVKQELLDVKTLMHSPEKENVRSAWDITLQNLSRIFDDCEEKGIKVALVIFPFKMQVFTPEKTNAPQRYLAQWAGENEIPTLDLLPVLRKYVDTERKSPNTLFFDHDHLSTRGTRVASDAIAAFLKPLLAE